MVDTGEIAPDFTAPKASGIAYNDIDSFTLSEAISDGPLILAFYPAAFTNGCTEEMCAFRDSMGEFEALDAEMYGISVDLPFAQNIWIQEHDLTFPMLSDWNHDIIREYDVVLSEMYGMIEAAQRSIFVIDADSTVRYKWIRDGENPNFDMLTSEVRDVVVEISRN